MLKLHIGNYNYSSWSMSAWLALRKSELPMTLEMVYLDEADYKDKLLALSSTGTVPVLEVNGHDEKQIIPDSLAICEFAAKAVPNLWPRSSEDKAKALEMIKKIHTGFEAIRREAPMNLRRRTQSYMPQDCLDDATEICTIWDEQLGKHNGPFLFDQWSIADAFYTPVATRFMSYDLPRTVRSDTYISELMSDPDYLEWESRAFIEDQVIRRFEEVNL